MALTSTTLSAAKASGDLAISVASAAGFAVGNVIRIDNEFLYQPSAATGTFVPVTCGKEGSAQVAHNTGAIVVTGLPSDFAAAPVGEDIIVPFSIPETLNMYTVAGAIALPTHIEEQTILLKTGTAGAFTLALPTAGIQGAELQIVALDSEAYTVTTPANGINNSLHIATFGGATGNSVLLRAVGTTWIAVVLSAVVIS